MQSKSKPKHWSHVQVLDFIHYVEQFRTSSLNANKQQYQAHSQDSLRPGTLDMNQVYKKAIRPIKKLRKRHMKAIEGVLGDPSIIFIVLEYE